MTLVRAFTVLTSAIAAVLLTAVSASASTEPSTWPDGESISTLEVLGIFVGLPVLLFVVVGLIGVIHAQKGRNYVPPPPSTEVEVSSGH